MKFSCGLLNISAYETTFIKKVLKKKHLANPNEHPGRLRYEYGVRQSRMVITHDFQ